MLKASDWLIIKQQMTSQSGGLIKIRFKYGKYFECLRSVLMAGGHVDISMSTSQFVYS